MYGLVWGGGGRGIDYRGRGLRSLGANNSVTYRNGVDSVRLYWHALTSCLDTKFVDVRKISLPSKNTIHLLLVRDRRR